VKKLPQPPEVVLTADLANYDGSAGTLVDTNIWIGCIDANSLRHDWAVEQLQPLTEAVRRRSRCRCRTSTSGRMRQSRT
jgi:hypothetical protein